MNLSFKQKVAFLDFLEIIKKMDKKKFNKMMNKEWMNIWKSENSEEAWGIFENNFLNDDANCVLDEVKK